MKVDVGTKNSYGFPTEALDDVTMCLVLFEGDFRNVGMGMAVTEVMSKVPMETSKVGWDSPALTSGLPPQLRA